MTLLQGLKAAIVDLDGTLVDTLGDFHVALSRMLAELGAAAVTREQVERFVGKGSEHLIRSTLAHVGAPADRYEAAWAAYQRIYGEINGRHATVYPGAAEGMCNLRAQGLLLACLTNKPTTFAQGLLRDKGLSSCFEAVFGGDSFERKKPDPLPVLRTCAALGCDPRQVLVLGDSSNDAAAARSAGCPVILVTYGYNHGEPIRGVPADGYVDSLADVPAEWRRARASR